MNSYSASQKFKLRNLLLVIFFAVLCQHSDAQNDKRIDSLINVLKTAVEDTNKVNTLIALGRNYTGSGNPNDALKSFQAALALATNLNFRRGMAASSFRVGNINYWGFGNFSEALKYFSASLKLWEEIGYKPEIAGLNHNVGLAYLSQGKYAEALKYLIIARIMYEENGHKGGVADIYNTTGSLYKTLGNYPEALKNYFAAIAISDNGWGAAAYNNVGVIYRLMGNYAEALKNHFTSLKIREEEKNKEGMAFVYLYIGNVYSDQGNYPEALKNHFTSLKLFEEAKSRLVRLAAVYPDIGAVNIRQGNFPEALKNYQASLEIYESKSIPGTIDCNLGMGKIYIKLNRFSEASDQLTKALSLSREIGSLDRIRDACKSLSELDSAMGNYQQGLVHYKLYTDYKDSVFSEIKSSQIFGIKEQFESEKKDKEILRLNNDKQKLESEKQLASLLIKSKSDSLLLVQSEKEKIRLENERAEAINLYNHQQLVLLEKENEVSEMQLEKNKIELLTQKAETDKKEQRLIVLSKEKAIQEILLNKQKLAKKYLIAGITLLAILSFFVYRNYRTRQQLKLQTMRNKIASDLHDDVGSTLSSISIFSQMAQQQSKETIPLLESIGESSRKMLDAMADIVWTIKPENDQFEKIIMRMRSFAYELLGAKKIDFEFIADEDVEKLKLPMEVRKNLYLIFKEATNNMVKYSEAHRAKFAIKGEKNNLIMIIHDDGKGFDANNPAEGNGLKNMKMRAKEIGAAFLIDSQPGSGTTIQLKIAV